MRYCGAGVVGDGPPVTVPYPGHPDTRHPDTRHPDTERQGGELERDRERGARGKLTVKDRALSRIAVAAALAVPGVVKHSGGMLALPGRDLPRAEVTTGPDSVAVTLYLAVSWPSPVALLSREVHHAVAERVETLTGFPLDRLHVVVAAAVAGGAGGGGTEVDAGQAIDEPTPVPARVPLARPDAAFVAVVVAVALLGAAVVAGREFLIAKEVIAPAAWLRNAVRWFADLHWQAWMGPAALATAVVGALLVLLSVLPRTRTHLPVGESESPVVWLRPTDVARMCSARAAAVGGVSAVHTTVDRRRATLHVTPGVEVDGDDLDRCLREAVGPALAAVASPLELRVRIGRVKR